MPDSSSSFDDSFSELFGKLPDPRARDARADRGATDGSTPERATGSAEPGSIGSPAGDAPLSRRAAREAAQRETGELPQTGTANAEIATVDPLTAAIAPAAPSASEPWASEPVATQAIDTVAADNDIHADPFLTRPAAPRDAGVPAIPVAVAADPFDVSNVPPKPTTRPAPASTATIDDLFSSEAHHDVTVPAAVKKRKRRGGCLIALVIVLAVLGGITAGGFWAWNTYGDKIREVMGWEEPKDFEEGLANGEALITIETGDTGSPISQKLYDAGVTKTPDAFYDYLIENDPNPPFVPGVFALQKQMTSAAALEALLDPANRREHTAQLPEGLGVEQTLQRLADGTGIPLADFQAAIADPSAFGVPVDQAVVAAGGQPLEGWLFPATYTFEPGVTAPQVIQRLVDETVKRLDAAGVPVEERQRILTIASIIQREARYEADMQKVATVIQNRMDPSNQETFGLLQMDSTAQYGFGQLHEGSASTTEEAQFDPNPWNTYVHEGLPVGPIANPGDVAIDAAMHPAEGPWLYFVTVNLDTGETIFTTTYNEHQQYVEQMQAWCSENPDSGC